MVLIRQNVRAALVLSLVLSGSLQIRAEEQPQKKHQFLVAFTDKADSPFSTDQPEAFLSPRAIERKKRLGITPNEEDLPVNPQYRNTLANTEGVTLLFCSRWFNLAAVELDTFVIKSEHLLQLPFVKSVQYIGSTPVSPQADTTTDTLIESFSSDAELQTEYGLGLPQIQMIAGHKLHNMGYKGQGMLIAVLDAGFKNVNRLPAFDSLFAQNRIIAWKDFVDFDESVWEDDPHGTNVLSCMGANIPSVFKGTAPHASYVLVRTENAHFETRIEEVSWLTGAEYADSIGADLISSSLGYTTFDDKEFSFTYSLLDGKTTLITRAGDKAFEKGILVMNSAGNEGFSGWRYVGAPADGFHVVAAGAVDVNMRQSLFSSYGPSYDKRIKPNISAIGTGTLVAEPDGRIAPSNGTSFSNPVLCGMMACLMQAAPDKNLDEIIQAVYLSGSHASAPNPAYGYGVPDFEMALAVLGKHPGFDPGKDHLFETDYYRGFSGLTIRLYSAHKQTIKIELQKENKKGKYKKTAGFKRKTKQGEFYSTPWLIEYSQTNRHKLQAGTYRLYIKTKDGVYMRGFRVGG